MIKVTIPKALARARRPRPSGWGVWRLSFADAVCYACMVTVAESLTAIYVARTVPSMTLIGVLLTLPATIGAVLQAAVPQILRAVPLPVLTCGAVALQVVGLLLMGGAVLGGSLDMLLMMVGLSFYWIGGLNAGAPWQEWLSKIIPSHDQNRFFSRRASLVSLVTLVFYMASSWVLSRSLDAKTMAGLLFLAAGLRLFSLRLLWLHPRPQVKMPYPARDAADADAATHGLTYGIATLCALNFLFRVAVNISSSYYSSYMLNDLGMGIMTYAWLTAIPFLARVFALYNWGKLLDDKGMFEGLLISVVLVSVLPGLWTLSGHSAFLAGLQVGSGIGWSGFELLTTLLIQHIFPHKVMRSLAFFLAAGSLGGVAGAYIGGQLLDASAGYAVIFMGSGILRLVMGFAFLWYLRHCHAFSFRELRMRHSMQVVFSVRHPSAAVLRRLRPRPALEKAKEDGHDDAA